MGLEHAEIQRLNGQWTAVTDRLGVTVDTDADMALFKRRAQRTDGEHRCYLVAELDGVKTYIIQEGDTTRVVVTRDDVWPTFEKADVSS